MKSCSSFPIFLSSLIYYPINSGSSLSFGGIFVVCLVIVVSMLFPQLFEKHWTFSIKRWNVSFFIDIRQTVNWRCQRQWSPIAVFWMNGVCNRLSSQRPSKCQRVRGGNRGKRPATSACIIRRQFFVFQAVRRREATIDLKLNNLTVSPRFF